MRLLLQLVVVLVLVVVVAAVALTCCAVAYAVRRSRAPHAPRVPARQVGRAAGVRLEQRWQATR